jgi:hypothetical protein
VLRRIARIATPKSISRRSSNPGEGPRLTVVSLDKIVKLQPSWLRWETAGRLHSQPMSKILGRSKFACILNCRIPKAWNAEDLYNFRFHKSHHHHISLN